MAKPLSDDDIKALIDEANQFLKASFCRVAIERIGNRLYFRGTFPAKPESGRVVPFQQRIATFLPCSKQGIKLARAEAVQLNSKLLTNKFDWSDYRRNKAQVAENAGFWVDKFEKNYRTKNAIHDRSWKSGWSVFLKLLPRDEPLTSKLLLEAVLSKEPNTSQRKKACSRLQALADFAKVDIDLSEYAGNYGHGSVKPRSLPSDELISEWCGGAHIKSDEWRLVLGLIAAFGLRPHEAFLGKLAKDTDGKWVFRVDEGKTGARSVKPFYPEWVEQWGLDGALPKIEVEKLYLKGRLGSTCLDYLRRTHKIPFPLYDLRHAYAVRMHVLFGIPETVGALMMGHTPKEHMRTYQKWLGAELANKAIDKALAKQDRPIAPNSADTL